ncbi:MAG TPA: helix-turn-helix transcriptional regulator [Gemmataceae bacterium]|jgi:transcriptional regulator with XRE-family HTH domain
MKPTIKPKRSAEQRAEDDAIRRQHAAEPIRQRPARTVNQQSFAAILRLVARFKAVRESQGLTLAQVAERMGIDQPALSRLETGKMLNPTLATLLKWAEALGQKLDVDLSSPLDGEKTMNRLPNPRENGTLLSLKRTALKGGEKGRLYDKGVLSVINQIESKGSFDPDLTANLLDAAYVDQGLGANMLTVEERVQAQELLQRCGWTLEEGKQYAAGVKDAQTLLAVYRSKKGDT